MTKKFKTEKEEIIDSLARLDFERLKPLIREEICNGVRKESFLREIDRIFNSFKASGEAELIAYKCQCHEDIGVCRNCSQNSYIFIGNISRNFLRLNFTEENHYVKRIDKCYGAHIEYIKYDSDELNKSESLNFLIEDRVDFISTPQYESKLKAALTALEDLLPNGYREVEISEAKSWFGKYKYANDIIGDWNFFLCNSRLTKFSKLYYRLTETINFIEEYGTELLHIMNNKPNNDDEEKTINWLLGSESVYRKIPVLGLECSLYEYLPLQIHSQDVMALKAPLFYMIYEFEAFWRYNNQMLIRKYHSYSDKELSEMSKNGTFSNEYGDLIFLSSHLKRRKELEEKGIIIPYYPNERN